MNRAGTEEVVRRGMLRVVREIADRNAYYAITDDVYVLRLDVEDNSAETEERLGAYAVSAAQYLGLEGQLKHVNIIDAESALRRHHDRGLVSGSPTVTQETALHLIRFDS